MPLWNDLLKRTWYFNVSDISYSPFLLLVLTTLVLVLGTLLKLISFILQKVHNQPLKCLVILFCLFPFFLELKPFFSFLNFWIKLAFLIFFICFLVDQCFRNPSRYLNFVKTTLLILLPFVFLTFGQAIFTFTKIYFYKNNGPVPFLPVKDHQPRVALLLFDELDIRGTFEQRPEHLKLDNLDLFKNQSFYAVNAYAGGPETRISIPALLTGKSLSNIHFPDHDEAELILTNSNQVFILNQHASSIFSAARALNLNSGIEGFYHPYAKLFGPFLSVGNFANIYSFAFFDVTQYILQELSNKYILSYQMILPFLTHLSSKIMTKDARIAAVSRQNIENENLVKKLNDNFETSLMGPYLNLLLDKRLSLSFLHFPYPHPPGCYSYIKDAFCTREEGSYFGNVKLVDKILGHLRKTMEKESLWDQTTIIVTSDHWLRKYWPVHGYNFTEEELKFVNSIDHRVPFLVKFAYQNEAFVFHDPFSSVLVHDIILEVLKGNIKKPAELSLWIEENKDKACLDVAETL